MRQFNIEIDKTSPKTSRFVVPANEHFSILVRYKNWEDKQEWLDYTLVDDSGTDVVKYKKEAENDSVLYFCGIMDTSTNLRFKTSTLASTLAPRDTIQVVALASSTQDNCYICSADYARTTGEGGGGGGGVSEEYVDSKVQEEATARAAADEALRADIPTKTSELSNDSGYLTEDATTLSVAFGGLARKITPKDVISFSSLTWQGKRHELGSKDYGVFDGNLQLDEAFWPAKPLPGYLYVQIDGYQDSDNNNTFYLDFNDTSYENVHVVNNQGFKIPEGVTSISLRNIIVENYGRKDYIYTKVIYDISTSSYYILDTQFDLPTIATNFDKSKYAFFIFIRCNQFTTQLFVCSGATINLLVDSTPYDYVNGKFFIPVYSNFMTTDNNVYIKYIDGNHNFVNQELVNGQTYFLNEIGNPNIIYIGDFAS